MPNTPALMSTRLFIVITAFASTHCRTTVPERNYQPAGVSETARPADTPPVSEPLRSECGVLPEPPSPEELLAAERRRPIITNGGQLDDDDGRPEFVVERRGDGSRLVRYRDGENWKTWEISATGDLIVDENDPHREAIFPHKTVYGSAHVGKRICAFSLEDRDLDGVFEFLTEIDWWNAICRVWRLDRESRSWSRSEDDDVMFGKDLVY